MLIIKKEKIVKNAFMDALAMPQENTSIKRQYNLLRKDKNENTTTLELPTLEKDESFSSC